MKPTIKSLISILEQHDLEVIGRGHMLTRPCSTRKYAHATVITSLDPGDSDGREKIDSLVNAGVDVGIWFDERTMSFHDSPSYSLEGRPTGKITLMVKQFNGKLELYKLLCMGEVDVILNAYHRG